MSKSKLQKYIITHKISAVLEKSPVVFIFHYNNVKTKSWNQLKKDLFKLSTKCGATALARWRASARGLLESSS